MIYRAIITKMPELDSNEYEVRIPYFEDNTGLEIKFQAWLCNQPGEYYNYSLDDVVYVTFEDDEHENAVIIGKLFTGDTSANIGYHRINSLEVTNEAKLPDTTSIGGYSAKNFFQFAQSSEKLEEVVSGGLKTVDGVYFEII